MTDEKKKINYELVSEQLESLGWRIISGGGDRSDSKWEHKLINRKFSIYEAALCHNLLTGICGLNKDAILYNTYLYMLRLLADGWSIDTSELYFDDVYISINDRSFWWRRISAGGKRYDFEEAKSFVESNEELDHFFSEYLKQMKAKCVLPLENDVIIESNSTDVNNTLFTDEAIKKVLIARNKEKDDISSIGGVSLKQAFIVDGLDIETLERAIVVLLGREAFADILILRKKIRDLSVASHEANEALERLLPSLVGIPIDEND